MFHCYQSVCKFTEVTKGYSQHTAAHWGPQTVLEDDIPWLREASIDNHVSTPAKHWLCGSHSGACNCEETSLLSEIWWSNKDWMPQLCTYVVGDFHLEMVGTSVHLNIMLMVMFMVQSKFMNASNKVKTYKSSTWFQGANTTLQQTYSCLSKNSAASLPPFHPSFKTSRPVTEGQQKQLSKGRAKKKLRHTFWPPLITRPSVPPESPENKRLRRAGLKSCWSATKGMVPINRTRCVGTIFNVPLKIIQGVCRIIDRFMFRRIKSFCHSTSEILSSKPVNHNPVIYDFAFWGCKRRTVFRWICVCVCVCHRRIPRLPKKVLITSLVQIC